MRCIKFLSWPEELNLSSVNNSVDLFFLNVSLKYWSYKSTCGHWTNAHIVYWIFAAQSTCGPFDAEIQICCNGVINYKPDNSECCGTKAHNRDELRCCDGYLSPNYPGDGACCGYIAYERSTQHCCDDTINNRKSDNVSCCMHVGIDRWTEMCCSDNVQPRPTNGQCCGPLSYNAGAQRCCNGGLIIDIGESCPDPVENLESSSLEKARTKRDHPWQARLKDNLGL